MRISDWSSDVCSSDLECYLCNTMEQLTYLLEKTAHPQVQAMFDTHHANIEEKHLGDAITAVAPMLGHFHVSENDRGTPGSGHEIGRASCRERVCQYV